jgi:hypothetical protein
LLGPPVSAGVKPRVPAYATSVTELLERELAILGDRRVADHIRGLLVTPYVQIRAWDYGQRGDAYPCWIVLEHSASNTGIAYCEGGFGPTFPWGLLFLKGREHMSMGMDSGWFERFLKTYFESPASTDLPIWRVFENHGADFPGKPISTERSWDDTWAEVKRLRSANTGLRYDCWQSIYDRDA